MPNPEPAPADNIPTSPHSDPMVEGTQETARITAPAVRFAAAVIANAHRWNTEDLEKNKKKTQEILQKFKEFLRKIPTLESMRNFLQRREASQDQPREAARETGEKRPQNEDTRKNQENQETSSKKEDKETSKTPESPKGENEEKNEKFANEFCSRLNDQQLMTVWTMSSLQEGSDLDPFAKAAEDRLRKMEPEMMAAFDESLGEGKSRLESMEHALSTHPRLGEEFKAALKEEKGETKEWDNALAEAEVHKSIAEMKNGRAQEEQNPLSENELREHLVNRGHKEEVVDRVLDEDYKQSEKTKQAINILQSQDRAQERSKGEGQETSTTANQDDNKTQNQDSTRGASQGKGKGTTQGASQEDGQGKGTSTAQDNKNKKTPSKAPGTGTRARPGTKKDAKETATKEEDANKGKGKPTRPRAPTRN